MVYRKKQSPKRRSMKVMEKEINYIIEMKNMIRMVVVKYLNRWSGLYKRYNMCNSYGNIIGYYKWSDLYRM